MTTIPIRTMFNLEQDYKGNYFLTIQERYIIEILEAILEENKVLLQDYEIVKEKNYDPFKFKVIDYDICLANLNLHSNLKESQSEDEGEVKE